MKDLTTYQSQDGNISFNVNIFEETVWLSQKQMAELFEVGTNTINYHLKEIFESQELAKNSVIRIFRITADDGKNYLTNFYNLNAIISVGYRVNSERATQFRQWATKILKQYLINGYAINEVRVRKIESSLDELVSSQKLLREDVDGIKNLLLKLIERPIVIHSHNQISLTSDKLEEKIIELLDHILSALKGKSEIKNQITKLRSDITKLPQNKKVKNKLLQFLKELGDNNSNIHKIIKGAGITKKVISELIKIGEKLQDLI